MIRSGTQTEPHARALEPARVATPDEFRDERRLSLRDGSVRLLIGLYALLQVFAWSSLQGYQLADSVEYMDRALMAASGQGLDGTASVRSFAFSLLFYPMFRIAHELGVEDLRPLVYCGRAAQMLLTMALVLAAMRLGQRLSGRRAGWVAGVLVALNPIVLRYSVSPVAGIGSALFLTLGYEQLLWRRGFGRSLVGGLWLGLAFLCSYKSLLPVLVLGAACVLRDRRKGRWVYAGMTLGLTVAVLLQIALDRAVYGEWGGSIGGWYLTNVQSRLVHLMWKVHDITGGVVKEWARQVAVELYTPVLGHFGKVVDESALESRMRQSPDWYLLNLPRMLVWPVLVVFAIGVARVLRRPRWPHATLLTVIVLFAWATSSKGDKSFRLWLPITPFIAVIGSLGWSWLHGGPRAMLARRCLAWGLLLAALPLCVKAYLDTKPRYYGAYWRAMEFVNEAVSPVLPGTRPPRVGSPFHWALFLRSVPQVEIVRSPYPIETWPRAKPDENDQDGTARRRAIRGYLDSLDWMITHTALICAQPSMLAVINENFRVEAIFYDHEDHAGLGPVCVLRRTHLPSQVDRGRRFHRVRTMGRASALLDSLEGQEPRHFERVFPDGHVDRLTFLGWEVEPMPGTPGLFWSTYHWRADTPLSCEYLIIDRTAAPDLRGSFQNNHHPTGGAVPMRRWEPGAIVSESFLMLARDEAFREDQPHAPIGGAYRRGDLLPLSLWIGVVQERNGEWVGAMRSEVAVDLLMPPRLLEASLELLTLLDYGQDLELALAEVGAEFRLGPDELEALRQRVVLGRERWVRDGCLLSNDNLIEVGRKFLPVADDVRLPDDGRKIASEETAPSSLRTPLAEP